jgi:hypothetical protein
VWLKKKEQNFWVKKVRNIEEMKREILITGHVKGTHVFGFVYQERVARGHVDICLVVVTASSTLVDTHTHFLKCPHMSFLCCKPSLFGKSKKLTYSLCLIIYKLKNLFGNSFLERGYNLFY